MPLIDKSKAPKPVAAANPPFPQKTGYSTQALTEIRESLEKMKAGNPLEFHSLRKEVNSVARPVTPLAARLSANRRPVKTRLAPVEARREQLVDSPLRQVYTGTLKPSVDHHHKLYVGCQKCGLCENRTKIVLWRGHIPCQVLFIGEGPGQSEDTLGKPFVGPSGRILDRIIRESAFNAFGAADAYTWAITNIVACRPAKPNGDNRQPSKKEADACWHRLLQFIHLAQPRLIVTVGAIAKQFLKYDQLERLETFPPGKDWPFWAIGEPTHSMMGTLAESTHKPAKQKLGKPKPDAPAYLLDRTADVFQYAANHVKWKPAFGHIDHPAKMLRARDCELEVKRAVLGLAAKLRATFSDEAEDPPF